MAIPMALTRGLKRFGKRTLLSCRGSLHDVGQGHKLEKLLRDAGLPERIEDITTSDEPEVPGFREQEASWASTYEGDYDEIVSSMAGTYLGPHGDPTASSSQHPGGDQSQVCESYLYNV